MAVMFELEWNFFTTYEVDRIQVSSTIDRKKRVLVKIYIVFS